MGQVEGEFPVGQAGLAVRARREGEGVRVTAEVAGERPAEEAAGADEAVAVAGVPEAGGALRLVRGEPARGEAERDVGVVVEPA